MKNETHDFARRTYLGAVLTGILSQLPVGDGPVSQERWPVAVAPRAQVAPVGVLGIVMGNHQMVIQPGKRRDK